MVEFFDCKNNILFVGKISQESFTSPILTKFVSPSRNFFKVNYDKFVGDGRSWSCVS